VLRITADLSLNRISEYGENGFKAAAAAAAAAVDGEREREIYKRV
jgi:hypothetical protein